MKSPYKAVYTSLLMTLLCVVVIAQDEFYYSYDGEMIPL